MGRAALARASVAAKLPLAIGSTGAPASAAPPTASKAPRRARHSSQSDTWAATTTEKASGSAPHA
jgi:hypothetical protein